MAKKDGFKTINSNIEEVDRKIRHHRLRMVKTVFWGMVIIVAAWALLGLFQAMRSFDSYDVISTVERKDTSASMFSYFDGNIVEYSNDGIVCMDRKGNLIWNQAFEMSSPMLDICEEYLIMYDKEGTKIYVMNKQGAVDQIGTSKPIQTACVAEQGTVAVLMKEDSASDVKLFDKNGKELAGGQFYLSKGAIPIDIAFSKDAKKLAVDMVDITNGKVCTTISFYNFGSVGQNEIDNNVGTYAYEDLFIPEIEYMDENQMIAIGDKKLLIFGGTQKPELDKEIEWEQTITSVFYNDRYLGVTYNNEEEEFSHHIMVYDAKGKVVMENDTSIVYDEISFLENDEICVLNDHECELFTKHSIKKFSYTFDMPIYSVLSTNVADEYVFMMEGTTDEVKLR